MKCPLCGEEETGGTGQCSHCGASLAASQAGVWPRALIALAAGSMIYLCTLYRGLTYAQRMNACRPGPDNTYTVGGRVAVRPCDPGLPYVLFIFSGLTLIAGFLLTLRTPRLRYTIASLLLAAVLASQWFIIWMDWQLDPTSHNLWPFEVVVLAVMAAPVYLGAALAHAMDAYAKRNR